MASSCFKIKKVSDPGVDSSTKSLNPHPCVTLCSHIHNGRSVQIWVPQTWRWWAVVAGEAWRNRQGASLKISFAKFLFLAVSFGIVPCFGIWVLLFAFLFFVHALFLIAILLGVVAIVLRSIKFPWQINSINDCSISLTRFKATGTTPTTLK